MSTMCVLMTLVTNTAVNMHQHQKHGHPHTTILNFPQSLADAYIPLSNLSSEIKRFNISHELHF